MKSWHKISLKQNKVAANNSNLKSAKTAGIKNS